MYSLVRPYHFKFFSLHLEINQFISPMMEKYLHNENSIDNSFLELHLIIQRNCFFCIMFSFNVTIKTRQIVFKASFNAIKFRFT